MDENGVNSNNENLNENEEANYTTNEMPVNEGATNYSDSNEPQEEKKKSKAPKIIAFLIIIAIVVGAGFFFVANAKSKGEKFIDAIISTNSSELREELFEMMEEEGETVVNVSTKIPDLITTFGGDATGIKFERAGIKVTCSKDDDDYSGILAVMIDDSEIVTVDYSKTGDLLGATVEGLFDGYVGADVSEEGIKQLIENIGKLTGEEIDSDVFQKSGGNAEKVEKIFGKYKDILISNIDEYVEVENNVEIDVDGEYVKAKKYSLLINQERGLKLAEELLHMFREDRELYDFIVENSEEDFDYTFEEYQTETDELITKLQEYGTQNSENADMLIADIEVYCKNNKAIMILLKTKYEDKELDVKYIIQNSSTERKDKIIITADGLAFNATYEAKKIKNKYEGSLLFGFESGGINVSVTLFDLTIEKIDNKPEVKRISSGDMTLLINTATEEDVDKFVEKLEENLTNYTNEIYDLLVKEGFIDESAMGGSNSYDDYNYDDYNYDDYNYYDYNYDDYNYDDYNYYDYNFDDYNYDDYNYYDYNFDDYNYDDYNYDTGSYNYDFNY